MSSGCTAGPWWILLYSALFLINACIAGTIDVPSASSPAPDVDSSGDGDDHDGGDVDDRPVVDIQETPTSVVMSNSWMEVEVSKQTGMLIAIRYAGNNLLEAPGEFSIEDVIEACTLSASQGSVTTVSVARDEGLVRTSILMGVAVGDVQYQARVDYTLFARELRWDLDVSTEMTPDREVVVSMSLPMLSGFDRLFWPHLEGNVALADVDHLLIRHGQLSSTLIPMATVYAASPDSGFSFVVPFEIPKPALSLLVTGQQAATHAITATHAKLRAGAGAVTRAGLFVVPHEGDWRPGLSWVVDEYPEYFQPPLLRAFDGEGGFHEAGPWTSSATVEAYAQDGVDWLEFHVHFPFYGLYAPVDRESWGQHIDQENRSPEQMLADLQGWEAATSGSTSYSGNRSKLSEWKAIGPQVYMYYQPFEAWRPYAETYFGTDISLDNLGNPRTAWSTTLLMNPEPESAWGQHMQSQLTHLLDEYAEADGIFYDRGDYDDLDTGHDDGVSMVGDQHVYDLSTALQRLNRIIFPVLHERHQAVWMNAPSRVEAAWGVDGLMAETLDRVATLSFLGLRRPLSLYLFGGGGGRENSAAQTEEKSKRALLSGFIPAEALDCESCKPVDRRYRPLFELLHGKNWVLSPHALEEPTGGQRGNIFENPRGDYLIAVVDLAKSQLAPNLGQTPDSFSLNVPVWADLPEPSWFGWCYLLSADYSGINRIDCPEVGGRQAIVLPAHRTATLVQIAPTARYELVRTSSPLLLRGHNETVSFELRNLAEFESTGQLIINTPWTSVTEPFALGSNELHSVSIELSVPDSEPPGDVVFEVITNRASGASTTTVFTALVTSSLQLQLPREVFIRPSHNDYLLGTITNLLSSDVEVALDALFVSGSGFVELAPQLDLLPYETGELPFRILPDSESGEVQITAAASGISVSGTISFVRARIPEPAADLFADDFSSGTMSQWQQTGTWSVDEGQAQGSGSHRAWVGLASGWTDYSVQVNTRIQGSLDPQVGWLKSYLYARYQDASHFYRFGIHGDAGVVDLYCNDGGTWSLLDAAEFHAVAGAWYTLRLDLFGSTLVGTIDGREVLCAEDDSLQTGGVALGVGEDQMVTFYDDVIVRP